MKQKVETIILDEANKTSDVIEFYLSTAQPRFLTDTEAKARHKGKIAWGVRVHFRGNIYSAMGCIRTSYVMSAQARALDVALEGLEFSGHQPFIRIVSRSDYMRECLSMRQTRKEKKEERIGVRKGKDIKLWEPLIPRIHSYHHGFTRAKTGLALREIEIVEAQLRDAFLATPSPFDGPEAARLVLPDSDI